MEVHVATDLWGRKDNLRVVFDTPTPSLAELTARAETLFGLEAVVRRPAEMPADMVPPFRITSITILVDDRDSQFVELVSPKQLYHRCQLFVFQPPHPYHSDSRDLIPLPRDPLPPYPFASEASYREEVLRHAALASRTVIGGAPVDASVAAEQMGISNSSPRRGVAALNASAGVTPSFGSPSGHRVAPGPYSAPRLASPENAVADNHAPSMSSPSRQRAGSPHRGTPARPAAASPQRSATRGNRSIAASAASPPRSMNHTSVPAPQAPPEHERPYEAEVTNLDIAHEVFQSLDAGGTGRVGVAEVKAALVTAGLRPDELEDAARLSTGRRFWEFNDWLSFCEVNPHIAALLGDRRGIRPGVYRATASPPRGRPAGTNDHYTMNRHRDLSPQRSRPSDTQRQQVAMQRLHGGLASVVTAKDRSRGDYSHAETMLPHSPAVARAMSPGSGRSTPRRTGRTPTRR